MADEAVTHRPQTTTIAMDAKPTKHTQTLALRKARCDSLNAKPYKHTQTIAVRKARCDSLNAKPYKHTQTIAVRKASVIVRFWKG